MLLLNSFIAFSQTVEDVRVLVISSFSQLREKKMSSDWSLIQFERGVFKTPFIFKELLAPFPGIKVKIAVNGFDVLELKRNDFVIIHELPPSEFSPVFAGKLEKYVREGGTLLAMGGIYGFGAGYPEKLLPVKRCETKPVKCAAAAVICPPAGIMTGLDWKRYPVKNFQVMSPKPDAEIFLKVAAGEKLMPFLAYHRYGRGGVFACGAYDPTMTEHKKWNGSGEFFSRLIKWSSGRLNGYISRFTVAPAVAAGGTASVSADFESQAYRGKGMLSLEFYRYSEKVFGLSREINIVSGRNTFACEIPAPFCPRGGYDLRCRISTPGGIPADLTATVGINYGKELLSFALPRKNWLAGEKITAEIKISGSGAKFFWKFRDNAGIVLEEGESSAGSGDRVLKVAFNRRKYRPGKYCFEVGLQEGKETLDFVRREVNIVTSREKYPIHVWATANVPRYPALWEAMYKDLAAHDVSLGFNMAGAEEKEFWDMASKYGFGMFAHLLRPPVARHPEWQMTDAAGKPIDKFSYCNPGYRQRTAADVGKIVRQLAAFPSFRGIAFESEPTFSCGDYSRPALEMFRQKYAAEPPVEPDKNGNNKDLWIKWMDFKCESLASYSRLVAASAKKEKPGILTCSVNAWAGLPAKAVDDRLWYAAQDIAWTDIYHSCSDSFLIIPLVLSTHHANVIGKPIWALLQTHKMISPVKNAPGIIAPSDIREQVFLALASGIQGIGYFCYSAYNFPWFLPGTETWEEIRKLNRMLIKYGPLLAKLRPNKGKIALLRSRTTEFFLTPVSWEKVSYKAWLNWHRLEEAYYALLRAHLPVDIVYEHNIAAGELDGYQSLLLVRITDLPAEVSGKIKKFISGGGIVYADADTTIEIAGIRKTAVKFDHWLELLKAKQRNREPLYAVTSQLVKKELPGLLKETEKFAWTDNPRIILFTLRSQASVYLFIINDNQKQSERAEIKLNALNYFVYDLLEGRKLKLPEQCYRTDLRPGDGKILVFSPQEPGAVTITAKTVAGSARINYDVSIRNLKGEIIADEFPVEISVCGPAGELKEYGKNIAVAGGRFSGKLDPAANDPGGEWQIRAVNLMNGRQAVAIVKRNSQPLKILRKEK